MIAEAILKYRKGFGVGASGVNQQTAVIVLLKYRFRAATVFGFFILLSAAVCLLMHTQYSGTVSVLVKLGRELVYRPEVGTSQAALPTIDKDENIASAIEIMKGEGLASQVIEKIGLERMYPALMAQNDPPDWLSQKLRDAADAIDRALGVVPEAPMTTAVRLFERKLKVELIKKTDIITVTFLHPDPAIAAEAANLVVDLFQRQSGQIYSNPDLAFQQQHVDEQRAALQHVQDRLNAYRQQNRVYDLPGQIAALLAQRVAIDSTMKADEAHIAELQSLVASLQGQRASTPSRLNLYSDTQRNRVVDDSEVQLLTLRLQERQMASHFRDDYGPLLTLRGEIALAQAAASGGRAGSAPQVRTGVNDTYQQLDQDTMRREAELKSMTGREEAMRAQMSAIDTTLATLSDRERTLQDLQQDVAFRTDGLKVTYDKLVEAQAVEGLNHEKPASFSVGQAAVPADPADPARPLPVLYTLIAALLGIVAAISTVFLSFRMSRGFLTPELAAQRLRLPVLAVIDYQRQLGRAHRSGHPVGATLTLGQNHGVAEAIPV